MSTPVPTNPNPFVDPNNALRQFNQYFGDLRKQYGEDAIRQVGFEPKEFQDLQASLRKLQLDPRATPEQHREAYMQARDTLARRLTTPLEATRSYSMVQQPKPAPSPPVANDGTMPLVTPMTVMSPDMKSPTQEQLYSYARAVGRGETGQWDPARGTFVMTAQPPQPQQGGLTQAQQPVMPSIATPPPPSPIPPQPPMPAFDPNAALQTFNKRAAGLNASGKGLFASGMVPDEFRMYQGVLRNLQLNPNSTPEQHADILNKSMAFLNQYSGATPQPMVDPNVPYRPTGPDVFNPDGTPVVMKPKGIGGTLGATRMTPPDMPVGPVTPMPYNPINTTTEEDLRGRPGSGMGIGAFLGSPGEAIQAGGMLPRLAEMFNPKPRQGSFVDTMPKAIEDPNFRFGETTQQMPQNAQAMAMGGLLRKYYGGGMC